MNSLKRAEVLLLLLLAVFGITIAWGSAVRNVGVDFYEFWVTGQVLGRPDVTNVYSLNERTRLGAEYLQLARQNANPSQVAVAEYRQIPRTYSTPFFYVIFKVFSTGRYDRDLRNYQFLMLACLVFALAILTRVLGHPLETTLGAIAIFSTWFEPFTSDMRVGNVNSIQLALLAVYLWAVTRLRWRHRDILGGAILAFTAALKPNVLFVLGTLALAWILGRRTRRLSRHAIGAVAGGAIAVVVAGAAFRSLRCWADWLSAIGSLSKDSITVNAGNFAPSRFLVDRFDPAVTIVLGVVFGLVLAGAMWRGRANVIGGGTTGPESEALSDVRAVAAGCLLMLLTSPLAWLHYYVMTIPILLVLLRPLGESSVVPGVIATRRVLPGLALVALAIDPLTNVGISLSASAQGLLVVLATVLLFALALRELAPVRLSRDLTRSEG
jgi:hypothetical protein